MPLFWSILSALKIYILFSSILPASMNATSYEDTSLDRTFENFGSLDGFYAWITSIANGSSGSRKILNTDIVEEVRNAIYTNRTDVQQEELLGKLLPKTVLFGGTEKMLLYLPLSLIAGGSTIVTGLILLFMQWCCCTITESDQKDKLTAIVELSTYIVFFAFFFCFILSFTIMYGISSSHLFSTVDNTDHYVSSLSQHFEAFINKAYDSQVSDVKSILEQATNDLSHDAGRLLQSTTREIQSLTGLTKMGEVNKKFDALKSAMEGVRQLSEEQNEDLKRALNSTTHHKRCSKNLRLSMKNLRQFIGNLSKTIMEFESQSKTIKQAFAQLDTNLNGAMKQLSTIFTQDVIQCWESVKQQLFDLGKKNILDLGRKFEEKIKEVVNKLRPDSLLAPYKTKLFIMVMLPATIILLFLLALFILTIKKMLSIFGKLKTQTDELAKKLSLIAHYTICFITWIVVLASCAGYVTSWSLTEVCAHFFEDRNFSMYFQITITLKGYRGRDYDVSPDAILTACRDRETWYQIAQKSHILDMTNLTGQGVMNTTDKALSTAIDSIKSQSTDFIKKIEPTKSKLEHIQQNVIDLNALLDNAKRVALQCGNHRADSFEPILDALKAVETDLTEAYLWALRYSFTQNAVTTKLDGFRKSVSKKVASATDYARDRLEQKLHDDVYSCRDLYDVYMYVGSLLCKGIRYPISGMFYAAAMIWASFLLATILFFNRANLTPTRVRTWKLKALELRKHKSRTAL